MFPCHEDFGIIPVEAQACQTPVLGPAAGGLLETVVPGESGFLYDPDATFSPQRASVGLRTLDATRIGRNAERFSVNAFGTQFTNWIQAAV